MCNHGDDKKLTYLAIMDPAGEIYMCECGALINLSDTAAYVDDYHQRAMMADELKAAISLIALEAIRHAKGGILRAVNVTEQDWENKGKHS